MQSSLMIEGKIIKSRTENGETNCAFELDGNEKKIYEYKGNIMATASYSFFTKEAIDRLVAICFSNILIYK